MIMKVFSCRKCFTIINFISHNVNLYKKEIHDCLWGHKPIWMYYPKNQVSDFLHTQLFYEYNSKFIGDKLHKFHRAIVLDLTTNWQETISQCYDKIFSFFLSSLPLIVVMTSIIGLSSEDFTKIFQYIPNALFSLYLYKFQFFFFSYELIYFVRSTLDTLNLYLKLSVSLNFFPSIIPLPVSCRYKLITRCTWPLYPSSQINNLTTCLKIK